MKVNWMGENPLRLKQNILKQEKKIKQTKKRMFCQANEKKNDLYKKCK